MHCLMENETTVRYKYYDESVRKSNDKMKSLSIILGGIIKLNISNTWLELICEYCFALPKGLWCERLLCLQIIKQNLTEWWKKENQQLCIFIYANECEWRTMRVQPMETLVHDTCLHELVVHVHQINITTINAYLSWIERYSSWTVSWEIGTIIINKLCTITFLREQRQVHDFIYLFIHFVGVE